jgi:uncharacterized protein (DUF1778 family)
MAEPTTNRKLKRPRVNLPLAIPLGESDLVHRAVEITGESRNEFIRTAAVARATQVLRDAGELTPTAA